MHYSDGRSPIVTAFALTWKIRTLGCIYRPTIRWTVYEVYILCHLCVHTLPSNVSLDEKTCLLRLLIQTSENADARELEMLRKILGDGDAKHLQWPQRVKIYLSELDELINAKHLQWPPMGHCLSTNVRYRYPNYGQKHPTWELDRAVQCAKSIQICES